MWKVISLYLLLKFAVVRPILGDSLQSVIELSTPITSFARLKEGLYLYSNLEISPYEGDIFHQSPLLLVLFTFLPETLWPILYSAADIIAALSLAYFATKNASGSVLPRVVAATYLFNPYSFLSSQAQSTNVITNTLICGAIGAAASKRANLSVTLLALATALSWYPAYLAASLFGIITVNCGGTSIPKLITLFVAGVLSFLSLAYLPLLSWQFLHGQFGTQLLLRDLTQPNLGLWWYFSIEMFDFFRPFFLGAFQLFLLAFPAPLLLRLPKQPLFTLTTILGLLAAFKPYPEASDMGLYLTLLVLQKQVFDLMEYRLFEILGLLYGLVLAPVFYYLWIFVGSGNANFYYAITLVYSVTSILILADSTWSAIRIDHDGGKSNNLIQL